MLEGKSNFWHYHIRRLKVKLCSWGAIPLMKTRKVGKQWYWIYRENWDWHETQNIMYTSKQEFLFLLGGGGGEGSTNVLKKQVKFLELWRTTSWTLTDSVKTFFELQVLIKKSNTSRGGGGGYSSLYYFSCSRQSFLIFHTSWNITLLFVYLFVCVCVCVCVFTLPFYTFIYFSQQ